MSKTELEKLIQSDIKDAIETQKKKAEENDKELEKRMEEIYNGFLTTNEELCDTATELNKLQDRINKAIEYINEMCLCSDGYANYGDDLRPEHIINILQGKE